ncbi:hypothetical protein JW707_02065 [Candidatus Woesearchaeota archaeon]|nr:hypothetical protein [Candidatus Woesearchaeota archaeon]
MNNSFGQSVKKAGKALWRSAPILVGVVLLVSLANTLIPKSAYTVLFSRIPILDSVIGSALGSILAGNPVTSYVLGGEMLKQGVSLVAVTAFLVAWVTVGVVQLPAESMLLGRKFALTRNLTAFLLAIAVAVITVAIMGVI